MTADIDQPLAQTVSCHNDLQSINTQQRAAMAQAALINFFGEAGTVNGIMNTVQLSHTQTSAECSDNSQLNISENQSGMSLPVSTHSYTIPLLTNSRWTATNTDATMQQNCNRQSYRVPQYYTDSHSYSDRRRVRRQNTDHHKERKHPKRDDRK